ncbi:MAG: hypothetical protein IJ831_09450 [Spirochaetales bacterium]|nr:hypothetical protein [Spirochaetales bacterium]
MIRHPAELDLTMANGMAIYKGASWHLQFTVLDRELSRGGVQYEDTPVDLTGCRGQCFIRRKAEEEPYLEPVFSLTDPENGLVTLSLTADQTLGIEAEGDYAFAVSLFCYDVYLTGTDGSTSRILQGTVEVSPSMK